MQTIEDALRDVHDALTASGAQALVIGGIAVARHGYARATADIDLLMATDRTEDLVRELRAAGYSNISRRDVATFLHRPEGGWRVDILPVDAGTFRSMWERAREEPIATRPFRIPAVEDLIAMKIFALTHGGERREAKDLVDIVRLATANGLDLDAQIRPLCERYGTEQVFAKIAEEHQRCMKD